MKSVGLIRCVKRVTAFALGWPLLTAGMYSVQASTFTVTATDDSGSGSLRRAIFNANLLPGAHTIRFDIPGAGPHTIQARTALPMLLRPMVIDGYSQPGARPNTLPHGHNAVIQIRLVGSGADNKAKGLTIGAADCAVRGLAILGFGGDGVYLAGKANTLVEGNFIGVDVDGLTPVPNQGFGIRTVVAGACIGGPTPPQRNLISANLAGGISVHNAGGHTIQGNYLGTDASGTRPLGNRGPAIELHHPQAANILIGGAGPGAGNILAASSGPDSYGLVLAGCFENRIEGNFIGTDYTGTCDLGNAAGGILVDDAPACSIGGTNAGAGNLIAFNGGAGVQVYKSSNPILGNGIYANDGLGIDLDGVGVTANDLDDSDNGANNRQNFPVLTGVTNQGANWMVGGTLNSAPNQRYRLEFFASPAGDPSGFGEGMSYLGTTDVRADATGLARFDVPLTGLQPSDRVITATATDPKRNTSEFSAALSVWWPPMLLDEPESQTAQRGTAVVFSVNAGGMEPLSFQWSFNHQPIVGATNCELVLEEVQSEDAGVYAVRVSNAAGSLQSQEASLTIQPPDPVTITQPPASQVLRPGELLLLTVGYEASGPLRIQWRRNGVNVPEATNATLVISNVQPRDAGQYTVAFEHPLGTAESPPAQVHVETEPLPMTDPFRDQPVLVEPAGTGWANNGSATAEPGEPEHGGRPGGRSLWITWQAPAAGIATVHTRGSSFDTLLAVYRGDALASLALVAADDDSGGYLNSQVRFNARAGERYRIVVDGYGGAGGDLVLEWSFVATPEQLPVVSEPPADGTWPEGSGVVLSVPPPTNVIGASYQWLFNGEPLPRATGPELVIASLDATTVGHYALRITAGSHVIETRAADLQINRTGQAAQDVKSYDKLLDLLRSGRWLRLGEPAGSQALPASTSGLAQPAFAGISRGYSGAQIYNTAGAAKEPGEPNHCGIAGGASHWFAYFAEAAGALYLNTDGSGFDTVLAVYTGDGTFAGLVPVACDNNSGLDGQDSAVVVPVTSGMLYFIAVDGVGGVSGVVCLNYSLATPSRLAPLGANGVGENRLRLTGQPAGRFQVQWSTDLLTWSPLFITNLPTGAADITHSGATNWPAGYYRAVTLP